MQQHCAIPFQGRARTVEPTILYESRKNGATYRGVHRPAARACSTVCRDMSFQRVDTAAAGRVRAAYADHGRKSAVTAAPRILTGLVAAAPSSERAA
jgi:hypothetical protein